MKSILPIKSLGIAIALGLSLSSNSTAYAQLGSETITVPLNFDFLTPMIEIEVDGKPARVVYDSGTTHTVLFEQSFPELVEKAKQDVDASAFGGDQTTIVTQLNSVNLSWHGIDLETEEIALADYKSTGFSHGGSPFFDGLLFTVKISDNNDESITVFDAPNRQIIHLPIGQKVDFETPEKFKLKRKKDWRWQVKMPVMLEGETKKRKLNLLVDTGFSGGLLLNREKLPLQDNTSGYKNTAAGVAGREDNSYGGRTRVFIGAESVLINTDIAESLPGKRDNIDGYVGWGFLRRFKTAFDFNKGQMIIDLETADLEDTKPRDSTFSASGLPMSDWAGMRILEVGKWSSSGLQTGDILTSIDGTRLSSTAMYSLIRNAKDTTTLCWKRGDVPETCGTSK